MTGVPPGLDNLPDGLLVLGPDGTVQALNTLAARLLLIDPVSAVGSRLPDIAPLLDERGNDWWACSERLLRLPGVGRQPERRLVLRGRDGDADPGAPRGLLVTTRYLRSGGTVSQVLVGLRDTASRQWLERSRADLVTTVAHELRSPLASIRGFTATLLAKWERFSDDQKKVMLATVDADADRVTRLLTELLDVSRIDSGRLELHRQVVDVAAAVRRVVAGRVAGGEPEARFDVAVQGRLPELWLDPDKLEQVLHNLVENALRHGSGTVTVTIGPPSTPTAVGPDGGGEIVVTDEGEGVAQEMLPRIFTRFWSGGARRGGTGLGLYIVKGIVEAHGGTVVAERAPAGGARFRVVLPAGTPAFL